MNESLHFKMNGWVVVVVVVVVVVGRIMDRWR